MSRKKRRNMKENVIGPAAPIAAAPVASSAPQVKAAGMSNPAPSSPTGPASQPPVQGGKPANGNSSGDSGASKAESDKPTREIPRAEVVKRRASEPVIALAQSAGSMHPQPVVEFKAASAPSTATSPEYAPPPGAKAPTNWLPAPLAVLDADYSQVLRMRNVRYLIVIGAVVGALWFGWYLSAVFVPLLIALGIAYVLNPLVEMLERRGISRLRAVVLIFVAFIAVSVAAGTWFVASLAKEVVRLPQEGRELMADLETKQNGWIRSWNDSVDERLRIKEGELTINQAWDYLKDKITPQRSETSPENRQAIASAANARANLLAAFQRLDKDSSMTLEPGELRVDTLSIYDTNKDGRVSPEEWFTRFGAGPGPGEAERVIAPEARRAAEGVFSVVGEGVMTVLYLGLCLVLIPVYTWFFLLGLPEIKKAFDRYLPGAQRPRIRRLMTEIDGMAKSFFRGRLIVVLIISVMTTVLFLALDVRFAFLLGFLAGVGILVPFASFVLSMIPAALIMAAAPDPSWVAIIIMLVVFCGIQAFEQYVLTPKLLGDAVELHPVTLLVGVFVMSYLFGVFGALLAVPLTAIAKTLGREFLLPYFKSLADEPSPSTQTRVIQKT